MSSELPFRAVADALTEAMDKHRVPGAALGILADGREEHATFGVTSINTQAPVGPETLFQIGSLTKTYTATVIWQLIDQGALALDAPVRTYLPDLRLHDEETAARVTVGNLLDHTGGWYGDDTTYTGDDDDAIARFVDERLPQLPQMFPLGRFFSYNNAAFILLGRLIEVATGTDYNTAMHNLLFEPFGLTDTLLDRRQVLAREYADGHYAGPINGTDGLAVQTPLFVPRCVDPAGGIWSTTRDVMRFARLHLSGSLRQMQEPITVVPGLNISIARSWFVQDIGGVRAIMHNGDTAGQHTVFLAIPERQFAFALFVSNVMSGVPVEVDVLDKALASYPGLGELSGKMGFSRTLLAPRDAKPVTLSAEESAEYAGLYGDPARVIAFESAADGMRMKVLRREQENSWEPAVGPPPPPPTTITFLDRDMAQSRGARLPFVRDDAGRVGWVESGFRLVPRIADS